MKPLTLLALIPALLLVPACSESDPNPPPPPPGDNFTVVMDDIAFIDPQRNRNADAVVTIDVGETVEWVNDEDNVNHTVESTSVPSGADSFDSGNMNPGDTFSVTFNTPGTYVYLCGVHPTTMFDARVIVEDNGTGGN